MKPIKVFLMALAFSLIPFEQISFANAELPASDRISIPLRTAETYDYQGKFAYLISEPYYSGFNYSYPEVPGRLPSFRSVLPPCLNGLESDCIEMVNYRKKGSKDWIRGELTSRVNPSMDGIIAWTDLDRNVSAYFGDVTAVPSLFVPRGTTATTWQLDDAKHLGGSDYLVSVSVNGNTEFKSDSRWLTSDVRFNITPIAWRSSPAGKLYDRIEDQIVRYEFPRDIEYQLVIRTDLIKERMSSWFNGRVTEPEISLSSDRLTISASPTWIPIASSKAMSCDDLETYVLQRNVYSAARIAYLQQIFKCEDLKLKSRVGSFSFGLDARSPNVFGYFDDYEVALEEIGKTSYWHLQSTSDLKTCNEDGLTGIVSSNAMIYTPDPPTFNPITRTLSYRIASTHLDANGRVNTGNFHLSIRNSVASCLWGVNPQELSQAVVEITDQSGRPTVGAATMISRGEWTYISLNGFSFSSPTFQVKVTSSNSESASKTPDSDATSVNNERIPKTAVCVKGKKQAKVLKSGKCPKGYKKK